MPQAAPVEVKPLDKEDTLTTALGVEPTLPEVVLIKWMAEMLSAREINTLANLFRRSRETESV